MHAHLPHTIESLLDLLLPDTLLLSLEHQIAVFHHQDWEVRHHMAANSLCLYVFQTYGRQSECGRAASILFDLLNTNDK
jgi:hypothetical protein